MIDPISMALIGAGIKTIGGLVKGGMGISDYRRGKKMLDDLGERPEYEIPEEIGQNQSIAQYYGQQGLDANTLYNYRRNLERGMSSTTSAVLQGGGSINRVGQAYDKYQTGLGRVAAMDNQARVVNRNALVQANLNMAQYEDRAFGFELGNYNRDRTEAMNLKQQGMTSAIGAIGDIGSSFVGVGQSMRQANFDKKLFGNSGGSGTSASGGLAIGIGANYPNRVDNPNYGIGLGANYQNKTFDPYSNQNSQGIGLGFQDPFNGLYPKIDEFF